MYSDAHVHLEDALLKVWETTAVTSMISCTTTNECRQAKQQCDEHLYLRMSCGIHPWNANTITWEELEPWMKECSIIGEIGMDSIWCTVPLDIQRDIFTRQIAYACECHKPVILHTKGQEKEIVDIIKQYPNTYLVHWYSCLEYLSLYKELDCYFSIGPDLEDLAVQQVVDEISIHRLLIESDGIDAIAWAKGCAKSDVAYLKTLTETAAYIAKQKQLDLQTVFQFTKENLLRFQQGN